MEKISSHELGLLAFDKVKEMILDNRLKPGEKIIQEKLAAELGISRTPLRSALQMLEGEELVEAIPRRGVHVKTYSDQEIVDMYDCRIALESQAIELFTRRATTKMITDLARIFTPYQKSTPINQTNYQRSDAKFHNAILASCGNAILHKLFRKGNLLVFINRIGLVRPPSETLQEHFQIIEHIESRDTTQASRAMRDHLIISQDLILQRIKKDTDE